MPKKEKITLTRKALYDLVWSKPTKDVAHDLQMSDVALSKWCRKMDVPKPGVGYWQKLEAGKRVHRAKLKDPEAEDALEIWLTRYEPGEVPPQTPQREIPAYEAAEALPGNRIVVPEEAPAHLHPLVAKVKRTLKANLWEHRYGWLTPSERPCLDVRVSAGTLDRALRIMDALLKALEQRGLEPAIIGEKYSERSVVRIGGHAVGFDMFESPCKGEKLDDYTKKLESAMVPSGRLVLRVLDEDGRPRWEWRDMKRRQVEDGLNAFVVALHEQAQGMANAEAHRAQRMLEEQARWAREAEERRAREEEAARVRELEALVARWRQAADIRAFVEAIHQEHREQGQEVCADTKLGAWLTWALGHANSLDPARARQSPDKPPK
jgi:hypothetical protein